tara:strand:- start:1352 stop:2398 length:1047 start_codon:yes stop_codon:yes gene_type:complete
MNKIFITGGSGFIGSNFIYYCIDKGYVVMNYDNLTYAGNEFNLEYLKNNQNYSFVNGDICNYDLLYNSIINFKPNFIVNFAAESHVDRSINCPQNFINTNILGTYHLLESSRKYYYQNKIELFKLLHISTDEVFGSLSDNKNLFNEDSKYNPSSPYSASKASSDHLVNAWIKTYNFPALITNCSNNYGPYQYPEKLIPLVIQRCIFEEEIPVYGDGKNIRDWIYVKDHCEALYKVLNKGKIGDNYLIGGNQEKTNIEVVELICEILDEINTSDNLKSYKDLIKYVDDRPAHDYRYAVDCTKINTELNWNPKIGFNDGIRQTVKWYLENMDWLNKVKMKNQVFSKMDNK